MILDRQGVTGNLVLAIAAGAVPASFQHGYNTGVMNAPQELVSDFINSTYQQRFGKVADEGTIDIIFR